MEKSPCFGSVMMQNPHQCTDKVLSQSKSNAKIDWVPQPSVNFLEIKRAITNVLSLNFAFGLHVQNSQKCHHDAVQLLS